MIELDGGVHDHQQAGDARREAALRARGLEVVRVRNEEVEQDADGVVARLLAIAYQRIAAAGTISGTGDADRHGEEVRRRDQLPRP